MTVLNYDVFPSQNGVLILANSIDPVDMWYQALITHQHAAFHFSLHRLPNNANVM